MSKIVVFVIFMQWKGSVRLPLIYRFIYTTRSRFVDKEITSLIKIGEIIVNIQFLKLNVSYYPIF